jgi:DNA-binding SARP family transcriptional activator
MDLVVLGRVRIEADSGTIEFDRAAERCVLATLVLKPGRPVHVDTLVENVWGDEPPARAELTIGNYVRAVRRAIGTAGGERDWIVNRRPRAYELRVDPSMIDHHRFGVLVAGARTRARGGDHGAAVAAYLEALALWSGDPLTGVGGDWADRRRHTLRQERLDALSALFEQQLKTGDHAAVATRATQLLDEIIPTDRMIILAMYGLARSGHHSMIPGFFDRAARRMWDAARVRPGAEIGALAHRLVTEAIPEPAEKRFPPPRHAPPAPPTIAASPIIREPGESPRDVETAHPDNVSANDTVPPNIAEESPPDDERDDRAPRGGVIMTAIANENVYQAGGNQYITEAP